MKHCWAGQGQAPKAAPVIEFWVPIDPVPKGRPRVMQFKGKTIAVRKDREKAYERIVAMYARQAIARIPGWPMGAQYALRCAFYEDRIFVRIEIARERKRSSRADLDNLIKAVSDALNKVAYGDDRQVVEMHATDEGRHTT